MFCFINILSTEWSLEPNILGTVRRSRANYAPNSKGYRKKNIVRKVRFFLAKYLPYSKEFLRENSSAQ